MKYNISKLIGSIVVFCLAVGGVFGYALYGAGKKSAQDQQVKGDIQSVGDAEVGQTSASVETTNPNLSTVAPSTSRTSARSDDGDSEDGEGEDGNDDDNGTRSGNTQTAPVPSKPISVATTPADTRKMTVYKNGTYTAVGSYRSPAGIEQISVTVTLVNDVITNTSAISMANDRTSERYEQKFIGGYASQVVGKNIDTVNLSYVSGSSLTPNGFNDALAKIKVTARA